MAADLRKRGPEPVVDGVPVPELVSTCPAGGHQEARNMADTTTRELKGRTFYVVRNGGGTFVRAFNNQPQAERFSEAVRTWTWAPEVAADDQGGKVFAHRVTK